LLRSLKDTYTQNKVFIFSKVVTQIKGVIGKSPKINIKYEYNIEYDANIWEYVSINYKVHVCILHASASKLGFMEDCGEEIWGRTRGRRDCNNEKNGGKGCSGPHLYSTMEGMGYRQI
jgi:hypothetical protein